MDIPKYAHIYPSEKVLNFFNVPLHKGLTQEQVRAYGEKYGKNCLKHESNESIIKLIVAQFDDLLVRILLLAAVISFILTLTSGDTNEGLFAYIEPFVIMVILVMNAAVGVWQESNAEKALSMLKDMQPKLGRCLRDGEWNVINAEDLVPGDIIDVRVGDKIPADLRLLKVLTTSIRLEQSQLTGESRSIEKIPETMPQETKYCEIQSKQNILFASTIVVSGHGIACVCRTGMYTEVGSIQTAIKLAGEEEEQTPLQKKLDQFGELLSKIIFVICALVWIVNFKNFYDPIHGGVFQGCIYYFKIAVALAVAAIPEGLPAVITTCLALGTRKMAKKNAIIRKLQSVETLGSTSVICSDKTGTLTTNQMTCKHLYVPETGQKLSHFTIEGFDFTPVGKIINTESRDIIRGIDKDNFGLQTFCKCASLCNESTISQSDGKYKIQGEATEAAIMVLVEKLGCTNPEINEKYLGDANRVGNTMVFSNFWKKSMRHLATLEFTRSRKSMGVFYRDQELSKNQFFVKGAPENILERCKTIMLPSGEVEELKPSMVQLILNKVQEMGEESLRTLCFAMRINLAMFEDYDGPNHHSHKFFSDPSRFAEIESDLTFLGLVGMIDPPRKNVDIAIKLCNQAGIKVIMITGDNKVTAESIACKVGIIQNNDHLKTVSFTGVEFEKLSQHEKERILAKEGGIIFSRTEPRHKQTIIKVLKNLGLITAMTGDGVNDAPALKQADIGISMGITGTEVAKEASDMILANDDFSTIVFAIREGRSIYNNMRAFVRYLISSNIGEVVSIFITAALGIPEGLAPVQLLWVNLVTDGPPATALGFNPPDIDVMKKPPRNQNEPLISGWIFLRYLIIGFYVGIATLGIFIWWYVYGVDPNDGNTLITFSQLRNWHSCNSWDNFYANKVYGMNENDPCSYFLGGKKKASTLSLTVLVVIEMLNALNSLSENGSLLNMPPWSNPWLLLAIASSLIVHCSILYIPLLARIFGVTALSITDWVNVVIWSLPVLLIDETLKFIARNRSPSKIQRLKLD